LDLRSTVSLQRHDRKINSVILELTRGGKKVSISF